MVLLWIRGPQTLARGPDAALGDLLFGQQQASGPFEPLALLLADMGCTLQVGPWLCAEDSCSLLVLRMTQEG